MREVPFSNKEQQLGLLKLADLTEADAAALLDGLANAKPAPRAMNANSLAISVPTMRPEAVDEIVASLLYLLTFRRPEPDLREFVSDVSETLQQSGDEEVRLQPDKANVFTERLLKLLTNPVLRRRSKANEMVFENARIVQSARIMTDVRPVFDSGEGFDFKAAIILHELRIEFLDKEGSKEIFLTLDDFDIAIMKRVLERAEQKARSIRAFLESAAVTDFSHGGPEESA